jgi:hypothetical protein
VQALIFGYIFRRRSLMTISRAAVLVVAALVVGSFVQSGTLAAHHGEAGAYMLDETIKLEGVVTEVRCGNPHVMVGLDVKGASGTEQWAIELSSIMTMEEGGVARDALKSGDRIIVTGHRHRTTRLLILPRGTIVKADGTVAVRVPVRRSIFGEQAAPPR